MPLNTSNTVNRKSQLPNRGKATNGLEHSGMKFRVVPQGRSPHPPEMLTRDKVNMEWVTEVANQFKLYDQLQKERL